MSSPHIFVKSKSYGCIGPNALSRLVYSKSEELETNGRADPIVPSIVRGGMAICAIFVTVSSLVMVELSRLLSGASTSIMIVG